MKLQGLVSGKHSRRRFHVSRDGRGLGLVLAEICVLYCRLMHRGSETDSGCVDLVYSTGPHNGSIRTRQ